MSKVKITRKEIEKMLKDQLNCKEIKWDKEGNCNVEIDFEQLKKEKEKQIQIIREPCIIPVTVPQPWTYPRWTINTGSRTIFYSSSSTR